MGYRQIIIKKSEKINFKDNNLCVSKENKITKIPLEDINYILVEDSTTIITTRLLAELGKNSIALIICDEKYEPTSILYPYNYHYKQLENIELQLSQTQEFKDLLWQNIIKSKIASEIAILQMKIKDISVVEKLELYKNEIDIGDITNREGLAAKIYFRNLFGSKFIRFYDDPINNALNYGYTILKSCIIRNLAVYGLNSYIGIHHKSKTNNFNLAFDLLEPYRSVVDKFVYENVEKLNSELSFEIRKELVNLLNYEVLVNNKKCTIEYSIELLVKSYINAMTNGDIHLELPVLIYD